MVLFGEVTIVADLAYLSWPKYGAWMMGTGLCVVVATGVVSITLRILAKQSNVSKTHYSASRQPLIQFLVAWLTGFVGPPNAFVHCRVGSCGNAGPSCMPDGVQPHQKFVTRGGHGQPSIVS